MTFGSWFAVYFVVWWVALFAVLPWAARSQPEGDERVPGTDPGAPTKPRLLRIMLINTVLSLVIFAAFYVFWTRGIITLDDLSFLPGGS
jgi:predicted secreted protein